MKPPEIRARLAAIAERLRFEYDMAERLINEETDSFRINELSYAMSAIEGAAVVFENLSIPESESAVVIRQLAKSKELIDRCKEIGDGNDIDIAST